VSIPIHYVNVGNLCILLYNSHVLNTLRKYQEAVIIYALINNLVTNALTNILCTSLLSLSNVG